jgi:hypothetical protein
MSALLLKLFLPGALSIYCAVQETIDVAERIRLRELLRVPAANQITFQP